MHEWGNYENVVTMKTIIVGFFKVCLSNCSMLGHKVTGFWCLNYWFCWLLALFTKRSFQLLDWINCDKFKSCKWRVSKKVGYKEHRQADSTNILVVTAYEHLCTRMHVCKCAYVSMQTNTRTNIYINIYIVVA